MSFQSAFCRRLVQQVSTCRQPTIAKCSHRSALSAVRFLSTPPTDDTTTTTPAPTDDFQFQDDNATSPLDAFRDELSFQERQETPVGRSWHARELRRKSFDDLHKLWIVLYKERNMLKTEAYLARVNQINFPQPERLRKVRKSMGAIRQVLGERKREKIAAAALKQMELAEQQLDEEMEDEMEEDLVVEEEVAKDKV